MHFKHNEVVTEIDLEQELLITIRSCGCQSKLFIQILQIFKYLVKPNIPKALNERFYVKINYVPLSLLNTRKKTQNFCHDRHLKALNHVRC